MNTMRDCPHCGESVPVIMRLYNRTGTPFMFIEHTVTCGAVSWICPGSRLDSDVLWS